MVLPLVARAFNLETIVSAGCETIAHKTPATYPEAKVTDN